MKTVSLSLAKKLKEKGYPQESYFHWGVSNLAGANLWDSKQLSNFSDVEDYAAPTADEILEQLLDFIDYDGKIFNLTITHEISGWNVAYVTRKDILMEEFMTETLADAAAKMWIYMRKENLL